MSINEETAGQRAQEPVPTAAGGPPGYPPAMAPGPMAVQAPSNQAWPASAPMGGRRRAGKVRKPWGVWGLAIITLGIYQLYWWYKINEELREYDERITVQPGLAVLALFVPIAGLVSIANTGGRISQAQRFAGINARCSGGLGLLLGFLAATHLVYYQAELNKVWAVHGNQAPGTSI